MNINKANMYQWPYMPMFNYPQNIHKTTTCSILPNFLALSLTLLDFILKRTFIPSTFYYYCALLSIRTTVNSSKLKMSTYTTVCFTRRRVSVSEKENKTTYGWMDRLRMSRWIHFKAQGSQNGLWGFLNLNLPKFCSLE